MNDWPCQLAKLLVQEGAGYRHDHPFWDFHGLTDADLRKIERIIFDEWADDKWLEDQPNAKP